MKFITFKFIIYSLIIIVFLHYIINYLLKNEKRYKSDKKNIVEKLSSEKENSLRLKKKNIEESNINNEDSEKNNEIEMDNMKNDILSFLENNDDLYQTSKKSEPKTNINDLAVDENMNQELKFSKSYETSYFKGIDSQPLDKFFNNNHESIINYNEKKKNNTIIEPQIDMQTKEKIYIDNNTFDKSNCIKPDNWKYIDENIMNGGEMEGGLTAWDNLDSGLAMYSK